MNYERIADWAARSGVSAVAAEPAAPTAFTDVYDLSVKRLTEGDIAPYYGKGQMTAIEKYINNINVESFSFWGGYYNDNTFDHGPFFNSHQQAREASTAKRLGKISNGGFELIPRNSMEISKTFTHQSSGVSNRWDYLNAYYRILWPSNSSHLTGLVNDGINPVEDYFATLTSCRDLETYLRLLAWYDLTGVSLLPVYNDPTVDMDHPEVKLGGGAYIYKGHPTQDPMYANFWQQYAQAVANIAALIAAKILEAAQLTQKISKVFDLVSAENYLKHIQSTLAQGFSNINIAGSTFRDSDIDKINVAKTAATYMQALMNVNHEINFKYLGNYILSSYSEKQDHWFGPYHIEYFPFPPSKAQFGDFMPFGDPGTDISLWGTVQGPDIFKQRNMYSLPFKINGIPIVQAISDMWNIQMTPLLAQIDWLALNIARLRENPSSIDPQEISNLDNVEYNMFLGIDIASSLQMKEIIVRQLAKSPLISTQPTKIALPGMQYRFNAVSKIQSVKAEFAPNWSLSIDPKKIVPPAHTPPKKSIWPWVLGLAAAGAAVYYSNK